MAAAKADITIVAAHLDLRALGQRAAIGIDADDHRGLLAAMTDRADLALADEMREVRTICHCGKKATMVVRRGPDGKAMKDGAQVQIGGNETYVSLCRKHWREEIEG